MQKNDLPVKWLLLALMFILSVQLSHLGSGTHSPLHRFVLFFSSSFSSQFTCNCSSPSFLLSPLRPPFEWPQANISASTRCTTACYVLYLLFTGSFRPSSSPSSSPLSLLFTALRFMKYYAKYFLLSTIDLHSATRWEREREEKKSSIFSWNRPNRRAGFFLLSLFASLVCHSVSIAIC